MIRAVQFYESTMKSIFAIAVLATICSAEFATFADDVNDLVDSKSVESSVTTTALCSINITGLNIHITNVVNQLLASQPVIKFLFFYADASRNAVIQEYDAGQFQLVGSPLDTMPMGNGQTNQMGPSSILAYRKQYNEYHGSKLGVIFFNLEKLFPCTTKIPVCRLLPFEDDGFLAGRAILQSTDGGNNFVIFGKNVRTFGFGIQGCSILHGNNGCFPAWYHRMLVCYLPRTCL